MVAPVKSAPEKSQALIWLDENAASFREAFVNELLTKVEL